MKIKTFSELREAAKDKAAKAQTTTKDKESDLGEQAQKSIDDWKKSLQELPDITLNLDGLKN